MEVDKSIFRTETVAPRHRLFTVFYGTSSQNGQPLTKILHGTEQVQIAPDLRTVRTFSSKPAEGYRDYHHMMTSYIAILENPAKSLANVTAQKCLAFATEEDESIFCYLDTNSSRAGLTAVNTKLKEERLGIIGVGGAGSYLLDLVAKTEAREVHLFDGDHLETHNAFRAPGTMSLDELRAQPNKAIYWRDKYARMRRGIIAHDTHVTEANLDALANLTFVFLCLDSGAAKRVIVAKLEEMNKPFIDLGIGLEKSDRDTVFGQVRITTSLPGMRNHFAKRVDYSDEGNDVYRTNIQIADLNALNATLAVLKWKRFRGFYADFVPDASSVYMVEGNVISNDSA